MIRYIIVALIVFVFIALIAMWIVSGGPRKIITGTKNSISNAIPDGDADITQFTLPWQPKELLPTVDLAKAFDLAYDGGEETPTPQERLIQLEEEYDRLNKEAANARVFGAPSPFAGKIAIVHDASGVRSDNPQEEYLQIAANFTNTDTIDIAGWTLESALSGVRVLIPPAAAPFIANSANVLGPVALEPGGLALVSSAVSPVGVSFRENACTGYLGQFQSFNPPLLDDCPSPAEVVPLNAENLQRLGDSCFDVLAYLPSCRFPQDIPNTVSSSCYAHLTKQLSYNGCLAGQRFRSAFQKNMWRIFLGAQGNLWRDTHDALRLLDANGKTVSVYVY